MEIRAAEVGHPRIADIWGERTPFSRSAPWPSRSDVHLQPGVAERDVDRWVHSACVLCSNGCGLDIAVKDDRMVGVRGRARRPGERRPPRAQGPAGLAGPAAGPAATPAGPPRRPAARPTGTTAMDTVGAAPGSCWTSKGPLSHAFYTSGQLMLEEYYTLAVIGKAGIGTPHMDGNTRLCTATAAAALKESFGTDGQPGTTPTSTTATRCSTSGTTSPRRRRCSGRGCSTGSRAPTRRCTSRSTRAGRRWPEQLDPPPAGPTGHQRRADQRPAARGDPPRLGRPRVRRRAHPASRRSSRRWRPTHRTGSRRSATSGPPTSRARRRSSEPLRRRGLHGAAGPLPVPPGHGGGRAGQQPAPAARDARSPRRRHPPDERAADGAEQPRVRRRRRPAGLPQLGEPGARPAAGRPVGRRPADHPALGRTDPRDADLPLRRAGLDPVPLGRRHQPGRVACPISPGSARCSTPTRCSSSSATATGPRPPSCRRGAARGPLGRADRHLHQRRPHRAPRPTRRSTPGRGPPDLEIWVDYARRMGFRDRSGRPLPRVVAPRRRPSRPGRSARAAGRATTPASPTQRSATAAASSGRAPRTHRTAPSTSTPTARFNTGAEVL